MSKILFFDIDGTLTDSDRGEQWPSQSTLDALRSAQANGHRCLICSGRNFAGLRQYLDLGMDGIVFSDGAGIWFPDGSTHLTPIPKDLLAALIRQVREDYHGEMILAAMDRMYATPMEYEFMKGFAAQIAAASGITVQEAAETLGLYPFDAYNGEDIYESDVGFASLRLEEDFMAHLDPGLEFISTTASYGRGERTSGEVTKKGVNKGTGIQKAVQLLNGRMEDTFGFGDSMNDASMIRVCHTGIAMGNGAQELKDLADYVTGDIRDDGLAEAMRHFGII